MLRRRTRRVTTHARPITDAEQMLVTAAARPTKRVPHAQWAILGWRLLAWLGRKEARWRAWAPIMVVALVATCAVVGVLSSAWRLPLETVQTLPQGAWVSSGGASAIGGGAGPGVTVPASAGGPATDTPAPSPTPPPTATPAPTDAPTPTPNPGVSPAPERPWPPSNPWNPTVDHPDAQWVNGCWAFGGGWGDGGNWCRWFGQCTWLAAERRRDERFLGLGNAGQWKWTAAQRGYRVGTTPVVGATVVFQPGVEGAGGAGHVAHVVAVFPDGWFEIAEMNFYWRGGGWGRIDWRYVYVTGGVDFIY